jgi:ATP-dependent DNA helicase RecQ
LRTRYPGVPMAAFTATATPRVQDDIIRLTGLASPYILRVSFDRKNLFYRVTRKYDVNRQVLEFIRQRPDQPGIVYRTTRKSVIEMAAFLSSRGIAALPYHGGLETEERTANQEAFNRDRVQVMVATIAFGMGIDKSNVRFVVHADLPRHIEGYYQETGRAGRDGAPADCELFFAPGDLPRLHYFITLITDENERRIARRKLEAMADFAASSVCRRRTLLRYFGEDYQSPSCGTCDVCTDSGKKEDITPDARTILMTVMRLNEQFGVTHVVDFTTGADTKRIRKYGHQNVTKYGAGRGKPAAYWKRVTEDLISGEYLVQRGARFPVLALGRPGLEVLAEKRRVFIRTAKSRPAVTLLSPEPADETLFESLRDLRRALAAEHGVPPYIVFSDKTLREMTARLPKNEDELSEINGVGEMKLKTYGTAFLAEIGYYLCEKQADERHRFSSLVREDGTIPVRE